MEIMLAPESAARIRSVLGDNVDLSPAAVPQALALVAEKAPDVYSEVLDRLSGSDIRLDSERALHRRHKRAALRRAWFGWGEYESDAGDRLLARRRVAAAVPIGLAAAMLAIAGLSALLHRPHAAFRPEGSVHLRPSPGLAPRETMPVGRGSVRGASLWPPRVAMWSGSAALHEVPPARLSPPLPPVPALPLPSFPSRATAADGPIPPPIVFSRAPVSAAALPLVPDAVRHSPVVYARDAEGDTGRPAAPGTITSEDASAPHTMPRKVGDRVLARLATGIVVAAGVSPVPVIAEGTDGSRWLGRAAAEPDGRVHIAFQSADHEGSASSAGGLAAGNYEITAGGLAAGNHEITAGGLAAGNHEISAGSRMTGVALEADHLSAGLPGRLVVRHRAAAAAAIGAVVQAASDYVQALARAGQITVADGAALVSVGGPAPAWTYAASRLADVLNPQTPGATIETLEIQAGTPCIILITGTP